MARYPISSSDPPTHKTSEPQTASVPRPATVDFGMEDEIRAAYNFLWRKRKEGRMSQWNWV